jgi:hypothetical protein
VGVVQGFGDVHEIAEGGSGREGATLEEAVECAAGKVAGDKVEEVILFAKVYEVEDVRVFKMSDGAGFLPEAGDEVGVVGESDREDFEGHTALDAGLHGAIDVAHAAGSDALDDAIPPEGKANARVAHAVILEVKFFR